MNQTITRSDGKVIMQFPDAGVEFRWLGTPRAHTINIYNLGSNIEFDCGTMNQSRDATHEQFREYCDQWLKDHDYEGFLCENCQQEDSLTRVWHGDKERGISSTVMCQQCLNANRDDYFETREDAESAAYESDSDEE